MNELNIAPFVQKTFIIFVILHIHIRAIFKSKCKCGKFKLRAYNEPERSMPCSSCMIWPLNCFQNFTPVEPYLAFSFLRISKRWNFSSYKIYLDFLLYFSKDEKYLFFLLVVFPPSHILYYISVMLFNIEFNLRFIQF